MAEEPRGRMRVMLKGIHRVRITLKSGERRTYYYAWRGGPRLEGELGSPTFIASYHAAQQTRRQRADGTMASAITQFKQSAEYQRLAVKTRRDYLFYLGLIDVKFGSMPLEAVPAARKVFTSWRDSFAATPRKADLAWTVLRRLFNVLLDRGLISDNPCTGGGKLAKGNRSAIVWSQEQLDAFRAHASEPLREALTLAIWTAQRQGDLLRMTWSAYDGSYIRLRQMKTGRLVDVPVFPELKAMLDAKERISTQVLTNQRGRPWTADGFKSSWATACGKAGITGVTFHDLRGTAVRWMAEAGCTEAEMASITGHSLSGAKTMLDTYWSPSKAQADEAIRKLKQFKAGTKL